MNPILNARYSPSESNHSWEQFEKPVVFLLFGLWILANILLAPYQYVVIDDPPYTDPAASYVLGQGFTSGAWYAQAHDRFFAGNVPLHGMFLVPWLRIFGFGLLQVHSMNWAYMLLGISIVVGSVRRTGWVPQPSVRLALAAFLLFTETGFYLSRFGRPDGITFFLACSAIGCVTLRSRWRRLLALVMVGFLSTWAGLQLVVAWAIVSLVLLAWFRRCFLSEIIALGSGIFAGLIGLFLLYSHFGVWHEFLASIYPHSTTALRTPSLGGWFGSLDDRSFLLVLPATVLALLPLWNSSTPKARIVSRIGLSCMLALPIGLLLLGKFACYYAWMPVLAGSIAVAAAADSLPGNRIPWRVAMALFVFAVLVGHPRRLTLVARHPHDQIISTANAFARRHVKPDDHAIYAEHVYYVVKASAKRAYYRHWYPKAMKPSEAQRVTLLIISPKDLSELEPLVGSGWQPLESVELPIRRFPFHDQTTTLTAFRRPPSSEKHYSVAP